MSTNNARKPDQLALDIKQRLLQITWLDGHVSQFDFDYLRRICPCASCRPWIHGGSAPHEMPAAVLNAKGDIAKPEDVTFVGAYAINIKFADGHGTGIYTWTYLRESCPCAEDTARRAGQT